MTDLERWALACLTNLRDRDLIKEPDGDHYREVENLITQLGTKAIMQLHKEKNND